MRARKHVRSHHLPRDDAIRLLRRLPLDRNESRNEWLVVVPPPHSLDGYLHGAITGAHVATNDPGRTAARTCAFTAAFTPHLCH